MKLLFDQGEIHIQPISEIPQDTTPSNAEGMVGENYIISHSEKGHHHLLEGKGVTLLERTSEGMKALYAIVDSPSKLFQDAANPHEAHTIPAGTYRISCAREYDPFSEQIRAVAD